ncbi:hypothetical protein [Nocardia brasiliensis]|uniref:hypothetical protein n=1 Tax=Nocardia brasiliensis TaxID=37326 RepID=UPI002455D024|nr:hypothetical protein [Nocardia brasiliensis]
MKADTCLLVDTGAGHPVPFAATEFEGGEHFLHLRGLRGVRQTAALRLISVVTGCCLFSNRALWFRDDAEQRITLRGGRSFHTDRPLVEIGVDDSLSLYEYESAQRLSRVVADTLAVAGAGVAAAITIDVPCVQYYCYLLEALARRLVEPKLVLEWFNLVHRRCNEVADLFAELLARELSCVGIGFTLTRADPLAVLDAPLRRAVSAGAVPEVKQLLGLLTSSDTCWQQLLAVALPRSFADLGRAGYVVQQLRAISRNRSAAPDLALQIDNYGEWRILRETHRLLTAAVEAGCDFDRAALFGIFPMERLFAVDSTGHWQNLYFSDPGCYALDQSGRLVNLLDLAEEIYRRRTSVASTVPL